MPTRVVTISHATGAGGQAIAHAVARALGFRYIDEEIVAVAARKEGVDPELVADAERRKTFVERLLAGFAAAANPGAIGIGTLVPESLAPDAALRALIVDAIRQTADRGQAVIVSHGAAIPLAGRTDTLRVLVTASVETRVRRVAEAGRGVEAARFIEDNDVARADYFRRFYDVEELPSHYDLVVNTDALSGEEAADIVVAAARRRAG